MRTTRAVSGCRLVAAISLLGACSWASAVDFSYSGFGNITAGQVLGGGGAESGFPDNTKWTCPCYIADYSHGSVYTSSWSLAPESRLGLQGIATFNSDLSFTAQVMARNAADSAQVDLEWAYLSYNLNSKWTLQVGRKRLPLFYYSEFQDVSFAYNWARVPPDVYGWAVVNYNGVNITFRDDVGGWGVKSSGYVGQEHVKDDPIARLSSAYQRTDVNWNDMVGVDLELTKDWFSLRAAINKSRQQTQVWGPTGPVQQTPDPTQYGAYSPQTFYSLAFNVDKDNLVVRSEFSRVDRAPARGGYSGMLLSVGYRFGNYLPLLTATRLAAYDYASASATSQSLVEVDSNVGATLRYQLNDTSSLKLQVDRSYWNFLNGTGMVRKLVTVSYDFIF